MNNNSISGLTYADIQNIAGQLSSKSAAMKDLLDAVTSEFAKIGQDGTVWSGDAAVNAKAEFDALSSKFESFHQAISDCSGYLLKVVERYKAVDAIVQGNQPQ